MPIRVQMPNGTVRPFREGTPKAVIRKAQADMLADMKASGHYDDCDLGDADRKVTVTQNAPDDQVRVPADRVVMGPATGADLNPYGGVLIPPAAGKDLVPQATPLPPATPQTPKNVSDQPDISRLSMGEEARGLDPLAAAGVVSSGKGDQGGVSYGAFQLSSKKGQVQQFLQSDGQQWADRFKGLDPTKPGGDFAAVWKQIRDEDPQAFYEAQRDYIKRTHFDPLATAIQRKTGVDVNSLPPSIQAAVWSIGVQHSLDGGVDIATQAIKGLQGDPQSADYQNQLLKGLYDARGQYLKQVDANQRAKGKPGIQYLDNILKRYDREYNTDKQMYAPQD